MDLFLLGIMAGAIAVGLLSGWRGLSFFDGGYRGRGFGYGRPYMRRRSGIGCGTIFLILVVLFILWVFGVF